MLKLITGGVILLTLASCGNNASSDKKADADTTKPKTDTAMNNTLSDQEKSDGWALLFDGQSTKGWHKYGGAPAGSAWNVTDGYIKLDTVAKEGYQTRGGGDIVTDEEYDNFDLKMDWKIAKNGNSGIIFYVHEDSTKYKETWVTGPEMQVLDNAGHPDAKIIKHRAGDLYDLISCSKETVKPFGEWNMVEIKAVNGKLDLYLNGENVISTTLWDDNWKKLIAGSKFARMPDFGTFKKGRFALQDHGNEVCFRNIKIRKL
jgi:Domain of Unknown Function (DUF1080)